MSYTAKAGKQSLKVFTTWCHTSFWLWAVCNQPHLQGADPPSRALPLRTALLTRTFHRKIKKRAKQTGENKSYQFPKQGKTLPGKQEWSSTSVLQPVPQQESQHSHHTKRNPSFLKIHKDGDEWRDPCTKKQSLLSTHNLIIKKKPHAFFFPFLKLQVKLFSAELLLCLHYSNTWITISLSKIKLT